MLTSYLPFRERAEAFARGIAADYTKTLDRDFGHVLRSPVDAAFGVGWNVRVKLSWSDHRHYSRGGLDSRNRPYISIEMRCATTPGTAYEYRSFHFDPEIGTREGCDWQGHLAFTVAHEVAHAAAHTLVSLRKRTLFNLPGRTFHGHGAGWRALYRELRQKHVNWRAGRPVEPYTVDLYEAVRAAASVKGKGP